MNKNSMLEFNNKYSEEMRFILKKQKRNNKILFNLMILLLIIIVTLSIIIANKTIEFKDNINEISKELEIEKAKNKELEKIINNNFEEMKSEVNLRDKLILSKEKEINALNDKIEALSYTSGNILNVVDNSDFKAWMDYKTITDKNSKQYKLLVSAISDKNGLMKIDNFVCVATGSKYGSVGDKMKITLDNNNIFYAIKTDQKSDAHTINGTVDKTNRSAVEFIINKNNLNKNIKKMGTVSVLEEYKGKIKTIEIL